MSRVSVVIPTHNHATYIREAIDSALAQTSPAIEVIVVDDGSTDETPRVLHEYSGRIQTITQTNAGVAAARNTGIAAAAGDYIAFLDSDDTWEPRKLERQLVRLAADPAIAMVHCGLERIDGAGRRVSVSLAGMEGWVAADMLRFDQEVIAGPGSNILVSKRVAEEVGGFDGDLSPSEDWDFCYRVATRYPIGYVREVLVRYRLHGGGIHLNLRKMENGMLLALEKAFRSDHPATQSLKNHSYGRLHRILAGSYFEVGQGRRFIRHMVRSLRYDPGNLAYFATYPVRVVSRRLTGS